MAVATVRDALIPPMAAPQEQLNVIALISGGKDSFFSALHCIANGHRIVALANLHPPPPVRQRRRHREPHLPASRGNQNTATASKAVTVPAANGGGTIASDLGSDIRSNLTLREARGSESHASKPVIADARTPDDENHERQEQAEDDGQDEDETDLNSFMYQTVGHEVIPLYADATGIPLYRQPIRGGAVQHGREYADPSSRDGHSEDSRDEIEEADEDETESMLPLLRKVIAAHPEANALCAGAILSTYQRTRVESVAIRLGLVPLAFLWKFPVLPRPLTSPPPGSQAAPAQLLHDMHAAGLEARIVKVASAGLDEDFLWTNVASPSGAARVERALKKFGAGVDDGAVIGEGGEFETLVFNGPRCLFGKGSIVVEEEDRKLMKEGGGTAWLKVLQARVTPKEHEEADEEEAERPNVRIPELWDARFRSVLDTAGDASPSPATFDAVSSRTTTEAQLTSSEWTQWCFTSSSDRRASIADETQSIVEAIRSRLSKASLPPTAITNTIVLLRHMSDFPTINSIYATLFSDPNPPARVTIACGDALSSLGKAQADIKIAMLLSVHKTLHKSQNPRARVGLHVQSRSYWAPANIGPYSQAISVPASSLFGGSHTDANGGDRVNDTARIVSVAGQIPLVPATMALPPPPSSFVHDAALALQHLWRIGTEMDVQWWTGAVAYVPTQSSPEATKVKAVEAGKLWSVAHLWGIKDDGEDEEDEDESGPDLWDRKYDAQYAMLGDADASKKRELPDWDVLTAHSSQLPEVTTRMRREHQIPPLFVAEVAELPRASPVEWHALAGLSGLIKDMVSVQPSGSEEKAATGETRPSEKDGITDLKAWHTTLFLQRGRRIIWTVLAMPASTTDAGDVQLSEEKMAESLQSSIQNSCGIDIGTIVNVKPELVFADLAIARGEWLDVSRTPLIPCASLWDSTGKKLAAVVTYRILLEDAAW